MHLGAGRPELNRLNARCDLALCVALIGTRAAKSAPSKRREGQWHEREYHKMLGEPLSDHCGVTEYSKKIVKLREQLMPHVRTIKLEKETLLEVFVQLMPLCNQGEGGTLEREMTASATWSDPEKVLHECASPLSWAQPMSTCSRMHGALLRHFPLARATHDAAP